MKKLRRAVGRSWVIERPTTSRQKKHRRFSCFSSVRGFRRDREETFGVYVVFGGGFGNPIRQPTCYGREQSVLHATGERNKTRARAGLRGCDANAGRARWQFFCPLSFSAVY